MGEVGSGFDSDASIVAYSVEMGKVLQLADKVASVSSTVLVLGESGTGKEVVARYIHRTGCRKAGPFIKINCGAIPETLLESELFGYETGAFTGAKREGKPGMIELATGGTLFLDEISELPVNLQVKLLQVIQERQLVRIGGIRPIEVDIRIIAATNRDIQAMVREGTFRADLFYRLNVVPVRVPPLRERRDDIVPLIYHFLKRFNRKYQRDICVSEEAKNLMLAYDWPGNVRELENLMERLVVTIDAPAILPCHLPDEIQGEGRGSAEPCEGTVYVRGILPLKEATEEVERQIIARALERNESTYQIAKLLGVNQSTVVRKIQKYAR
ncbi:MAG: sigma 54-interacting transcriptional regulator [Firmicutes bacterium]|nr:sigma 54-interacting transcriptional regulator [Bacillota bacterium]